MKTSNVLICTVLGSLHCLAASMAMRDPANALPNEAAAHGVGAVCYFAALLVYAVWATYRQR